MSVEPRCEQTAIRTDLGAIFVSMELSRSVWLITSLSPGSGETMSTHSVRGGDVAGLLMRFAQLQEKARSNRLDVSDHRGSGWVLDPSRAGERGH
jgi:transposase